MIALDNDEDSSSDEECNIYILCSCQLSSCLYTTANFLFIPSSRVVARAMRREEGSEKAWRDGSQQTTSLILVMDCNIIHALVFVVTRTFRCRKT